MVVGAKKKRRNFERDKSCAACRASRQRSFLVCNVNVRRAEVRDEIPTSQAIFASRMLGSRDVEPSEPSAAPASRHCPRRQNRRRKRKNNARERASESDAFIFHNFSRERAALSGANTSATAALHLARAPTGTHVRELFAHSASRLLFVSLTAPVRCSF